MKRIEANGLAVGRLDPRRMNRAGRSADFAEGRSFLRCQRAFCVRSSGREGRPLKKGTGSRLRFKHLAILRSGEGACPLFQRTRNGRIRIIHHQEHNGFWKGIRSHHFLPCGPPRRKTGMTSAVEGLSIFFLVILVLLAVPELSGRTGASAQTADPKICANLRNLWIRSAFHVFSGSEFLNNCAAAPKIVVASTTK